MDQSPTVAPEPRVFLQPVAAPSILGEYAFAGSSFMTASYLAGWYGGIGSLEYIAPFAAAGRLLDCVRRAQPAAARRRLDDARRLVPGASGLMLEEAFRRNILKRAARSVDPSSLTRLSRKMKAMLLWLCLICASLLCACDRGAASHLAPELAANASRAIISPGEAGGGTLPRAPMVRSVAEYFATLDQRFVPSAARGVHAVYELNLTGDGVYEVVVDDGRMQVLRGAPRRPDTILSMNAVEYVEMVNGQLDGTHAYFSRHLKISGSLGLARRMRAMFPSR